MAEKKDYKIQKKRSGRYAVVGRNGKFINGDEKLKILITEGLVKAAAPKEKAAEQAEA